MCDTSQGQAVANEIGARAYRECSSLLNQGVDDIFEAATRQAMLVRQGAASAQGGSAATAGPTNGHGNGAGEKGDRRKSGMPLAATGAGDKTAGEESKGCCVIL